MSANLEDIILTSKKSVNIKMEKMLQNITIKAKIDKILENKQRKCYICNRKRRRICLRI